MKELIVSKDVIHITNEGIFDVDITSEHREIIKNKDIKSPNQNNSKVKLKNLSHHRISSKAKLAYSFRARSRKASY